jgi:hypothetical protein
MSISYSEFIRRVRSKLHERLEGAFYYSASTTSAGTFNTLTLSGLNVDPAAIKGHEVHFISGENSGLYGEINEWDNSSKTATLLEPMEYTIPAGVTVAIYPNGYFSDLELSDFGSEAATFVYNALDTESNSEALTKSTQSIGVTNEKGAFTLPTDRANNDFIVCINGIPASKVAKGRVSNDTFLEAGYFIDSSTSAQFKAKGVTSGSVSVEIWYSPTPPKVVTGANMNWPEKLIPAIINRTVALALLKRERIDLYQAQDVVAKEYIAVSEKEKVE